MAYNKTSEERKWNYWKEQEEKKLRELGMEEEKIQKLRQMDREDFWKSADTGNIWINDAGYGFHKTKGQRTVCTGYPGTFRQHWRSTDL